MENNKQNVNGENSLSKKEFQQKVINYISSAFSQEGLDHTINLKEAEEVNGDVVLNVGSNMVGLMTIEYYEKFKSQGLDLNDAALELSNHYTSQIIQLIGNSNDLDIDNVKEEDIILTLLSKDAIKDYVITEPFIGNLVIGYAIDSASARYHLTKELLEKFQINFQSFKENGLKNLESRIFSQNITDQASEMNMYLTYNFDNASSLLLFYKFWDILSFKPNGELIICVEDQHTIHYTGSNSKLGVKILQEKCNAYCPHLLSLQDEKYSIYDIPPIGEIGIAQPGLIDPFNFAIMNMEKENQENKQQLKRKWWKFWIKPSKN